MDDLDTLSAACHAHLDTVGLHIALMKWGSISVTVLAAVLSATTAAFEKYKKALAAGAVAMAGLSAFVQALPLDSNRELQTSAGAHAREGDRARVQVPTIHDEVYRASLDRYARSRYVDCSAVEPQATVPPLPTGAGAAVTTEESGFSESAASMTGEADDGT